MKVFFKLGFLAYCSIVLADSAAIAAAQADIVDPTLSKFLLDLVITLSQKHPILMGIWAFMGACRTFFKPIMKILKDVVELTPWESDNIWLAKLWANKYFNYFAFLLDWSMSIKMPEAPKPQVEPKAIV